MNKENLHQKSMFRIFMSFLLIFLFLGIARPKAWAGSEIPVAVLDFVSQEKELKDIGGKVAMLLSVQLSVQEGILVIERQELEKALGEQALGISGTVSPDTAAQIGQLTGAKVIITGRAFSINNELMLVAKIIGVETSRVYGETVTGSKKASIAKLVEQLAQKVGKTLQSRGTSLIAKKQKPQDRIAKLRKLIKGKKLPSISISIQEQSIGQKTMDPAAETEISKIFLELGFEVVDAQTTTKPPDIELTGEAFSEFGMKKGSLFSSKGRVEIKVIDPLSGKVLVVDRQTEVGVDLSREIAGKQALQKAGAILAERIIPRIVH